MTSYRPTSPGIWTREVKFYRVWNWYGLNAEQILPDGSLANSIDVRTLPTGGWQKVEPAPPVIEGRGQAAETGWYWNELSDSSPQIVYKQSGDVLYRGVRYIKAVPPTFPPRVHFTPPPKPEQVLARGKATGRIEWLQCGTFSPEVWEVIDEITGQPIERSETGVEGREDGEG